MLQANIRLRSAVAMAARNSLTRQYSTYSLDTNQFADTVMFIRIDRIQKLIPIEIDHINSIAVLSRIDKRSSQCWATYIS